jgi:hypothetical protein
VPDSSATRKLLPTAGAHTTTRKGLGLTCVSNENGEHHLLGTEML